MNHKVRRETKAVQALHYKDPLSGSVIPPIYTSTTYARNENYELISEKYSYGRDENPSYIIPEKMLAELEGGEEALLFKIGRASCRERV